MSREPSRADREFEQRLRSIGIELPAARIQRFRELGLLPAPDPIYPGGGGRDGRYPDVAMDQIHEALELAEEYRRTLWIAVLAMFARGNFSVAQAKLKHAFLRAYDRFEHEFREAAGSQVGDPDDASEIAMLAGPVIAKRIARDPASRELRRRIRRGKEPRLSILSSVLSNMIMAFLSGGPLAEDGLQEIFDTIGLSAAADDPFAHGQPLVASIDPADFSELFAVSGIENVRQVIRGATLDELETARDNWKDFLRLAELAREVFPRLTGSADAHGFGGLTADGDLDVALGAVVVLLLRSRWQDDVEVSMTQMRFAIGGLRAKQSFLDFFPSQYHGIIGPDASVTVDSLSQGEREEFAYRWAQFEQLHPLQARALQ